MQILHEKEGGAVHLACDLYGAFWSRTQRAAAGIQFVEMSLESLLRFLWKTGKFDSHADAGITGAHDCARRKPFLADPEVDSQRGRHRKRHDGFNITAVSADVGCIDT